VVSVVSLTANSGGYINGRNSANLELLIDKFLKRHLHLRNRLLDQGYEQIRLIRSLKKFIFRYQGLVEMYSVSAETVVSLISSSGGYINGRNSANLDLIDR
jgi:hypothetical protein